MISSHPSAVVVAVASCFMAGAQSAAGDFVYGFTHLTNNGGIAPQYSSQFAMTLLDHGLVGSNWEASFKFTNNVGLASSITDIYFFDGVILTIPPTVTQSSGVAFGSPATPGHLPGWSNPNSATWVYTTDSNNPSVANGVNASSEWVTFRFKLQSGQNFIDLLDHLATGTLNVGVHVQGQANGQSNSYVLIPLPTGVALGSAGIAGVIVMGLRRRRCAIRMTNPGI